MTLKELRAAYKAKLEALRTLALAGITDANRTEYTNTENEMRGLGDQVAQLQAIEDRSAEVRTAEEAEERSAREAQERARAGRPALPQPGAVDTRSAEQRDTEYRSALLQYMLTGDRSELRVQQSTVGANGGYSIPITLLSTLEKALLTYGGVASHVRQMPTASGEPINYPVSNNTTLAATVIAENTAVSDTTVVMGSKSLTVSTLNTGVVRIPFQLMQDGVFNWEDFARGELGEMYARGLANYLGGLSTDASFDALPTIVPVGFTSAAPTVVGLTEITGLFGAVDPAYANDGTWVMNRTTQLNLAAQRYTSGTPVFPVDPSDGQLKNLYGRPIVIDTTLPNIGATTKPIVFGNLQKYILRSVPGLEIKRLEERYAEFGQVAFLGFFRAGGRLLDAGTHPIQSLQQHA